MELFPYKKETFFKKNIYLYIRKGGQMSGKQTAFSKN
jgi:hypothetical protein